MNNEVTTKIDVTPTNDLIIRTSSLNYSDLKGVVSGRVLALCVEGFIQADICQEVSKRILSKKYEYYEYAEQVVGRYGMSFSEAVSKEKEGKYYSESLQTMTSLRQIFAPYQPPIDQLRLRLDEICPAGAKLEQVEENKKMFAGLCRVIDPHKIVLPHQDDIRWDHPQDNLANLINQLAVNIYLKLPETGGALELWDYGFSTKEEYSENAAGSYGISKDKIKPPAVSITPKVGELIIFNPRNLHCILPGDDIRMSQSCFLGYWGDDKPMTFWS